MMDIESLARNLCMEHISHFGGGGGVGWIPYISIREVLYSTALILVGPTRMHDHHKSPIG